MCQRKRGEAEKETYFDGGDGILHHLVGHVVHVVVAGVVHGGIEEHEHDVTLELCSGTNRATLNVALDLLQVHWSEGKLALISCLSFLS